MPDLRVLANIRPPLDELVRGLGLNERAIERLAANAINRSLPTVRTRITGDLADEVNLRVSDIRRQFRLQRASAGPDPTGKVELTGRRIPIIDFLGGRQDDAGYEVQILKDAGQELLPRAFEASMSSGYDGVFQRMRKGGDRGQDDNLSPGEQLVGRLPIHQRFGPALSSILQDARGMLESEVQQAGQVLEKNVANQIDLLIMHGRIPGLTPEG